MTYLKKIILTPPHLALTPVAKTFMLPGGMKTPKDKIEKERRIFIVNDFLGENSSQIFCLNLGIVEIRKKKILPFWNSSVQS